MAPAATLAAVSPALAGSRELRTLSKPYFLVPDRPAWSTGTWVTRRFCPSWEGFSTYLMAMASVQLAHSLIFNGHADGTVQSLAVADAGTDPRVVLPDKYPSSASVAFLAASNVDVDVFLEKIPLLNSGPQPDLNPSTD